MKKDSLKNTLTKYLKVHSPLTFTNNVMRKIEEDIFLKSQLKEPLLQKASNKFTANVLIKCLPEPITNNYEPVISKKGWIVIGFVLIVLMLFSFRYSKPGITSKYIDNISNVFSSKLNLILQLFTSNNFLMILIISVLSLIMFDFLLNSSKSIFKNV